MTTAGALGLDLDTSQRAVVELTDDVDAVVLGAAGTGRTTVAIELVADRVLARGWDPGEILVIAADRRAAARLRDRLADRLGVPTPGTMVRTVQSLANAIVLDDAKSTGIPLPLYLTGADHDRIIRELLDEDAPGEAAIDWPVPRATRLLQGFRSELRGLLAEATARGLGAAGLADTGRQHGRPAWVAAGAFMRQLGERIERDYPEFTPLDSAFVLRRAAELASEGRAGLARQRLVVVDDAQELGHGALELLRRLAARVPLDTRTLRIVMLGDPDLATGGFRGARPGAFLAAPFWRDLGEPRRLTLDRSHRHGSAIAGALERIVERIGRAGAAPHRSPAVPPDRGDEVRAVRVGDDADRAAYVARVLRERHVHQGVPWSSLAVIVRTSTAAVRLARELRTLQVPAESAGVAPVGPEEHAVRGLTLPIEIALGIVELDGEHAEALLTGAVGRIDVVALRRLRTALRIDALAAGRDEGSRTLLTEAMRTPGIFAGIDSAAARRARTVAELLERVRAAAAGHASIEELLWLVWSGSGLIEEWGRLAFGAGTEADEANRHLDAVVELFAAAHRYVERHPEGGAEVFLRSWLDATVRQDTLARREVEGRVVVGTPAQVVGLEFDTVILAELEDGIWPNLRVRGSLLGVQDLVDVWDGITPGGIDRRRQVLHDELRLLALAASRARSRLIGVGIAGEDRASSPFLRLLAADGEVTDVSTEAVAPLTLRGLTGRLRRELTGGRAPDGTRRRQEIAAAQALARLASAGLPGAHPDEWYGRLPISTTEPLAAPGEPVRVSPSTIDRFGTCELHWAIEHLGGGGQSIGASVGTIVHDVAERIADEDAETLLPAVLAQLRELDYEADWVRVADEQRARDLVEHLVAYQRELARAGGVTVGRELRLALGYGRAEVRGRIDRIERYPDGTAVIVDFKTGAESRYTSDNSVAEHAQLATYQLALVDGGLRDADGEAVELALRHGGAQLVILSRTTAKTDFAALRQPPLDEAAAAEWRARIEATAEGMAGGAFIARVAAHCANRYAYGPCRIHIVGQVSA